MSSNLSPQKIADTAESNHAQDQAKALMAKHDYVKAESIYQTAINLKKKADTDDFYGLACLTEELGVCRLKAGKPQDALSSFQDALKILEEHYYAGHYYLAPVLEHMGVASAALSKWEEAESHYKRALDIYEKTLSGEHRYTLTTMHKLASTQRQLGKFADAEAVLNKGLKQIDTPLGPSEEFRYELALMYQDQGKNTEAEAQFKQAIEGYFQRRNFSRLADCLESFGTFLAKIDRKAASQTILTQAKKFKEVSRGYTHSEEFFPSTLLRA